MFLWNILVFLLENFWSVMIVAFVLLVIARLAYRIYRNGFTVEEMRHIVRRAPLYMAVLFFCFFALLPFMIMFLHTFKTDSDLYRRPQPFVFRDEPTLEHIEFLFNGTDYAYFIRNSIVVGIAVVIITLVLAVPAAYALARLTGHWGNVPAF